ncbi:MAG: protein phosphatase 2C domain-containing protein [Bacillaceae bacterium]
MKVEKIAWVGNEQTFIDHCYTEKVGNVTIGRYGGNSLSGAVKNEDGCLIWSSDKWEFVVILDAHDSSESAQVLIQLLHEHEMDLLDILANDTIPPFKRIEDYLLSLFQSEVFKEKCRQVRGETACLICLRYRNFLWWFSVGDCLLYLLHPELHLHGQCKINSRQFFEWIGKRNTFELEMPCFTSGIRELRSGRNQFLLVTDGLLEAGDCYFNTDENAYHFFVNEEDEEQTVSQALHYIEKQQGRDSATVICWHYDNPMDATYPDNYYK